MYTIHPKTVYTDRTDEPNGCSIKVPSDQPVYVTGAYRGMGAVDAKDISWSASWVATLRNAHAHVTEHNDHECGSIQLKDGIHRVFMTLTGYVYVDGRIY